MGLFLNASKNLALALTVILAPFTNFTFRVTELLYLSDLRGTFYAPTGQVNSNPTKLAYVRG
jgi:hypothetical protein